MISNYILKQRIATVLISILLSVIVSTNSNSANSSGLSTQTEEPSPAALQLRVIDPSWDLHGTCLLYTSPSPRDMRRSRMPSSA